MSLLDVEGLRVRLRGATGMVTVVDGVDYRVEQGEVFGIAGESGSGKTISMLALLGLLPEGAAVEGRVRFDDRDLLGLSRSRAAGDLGARPGDGLPGPAHLPPPDALGRAAADRARPAAPRARAAGPPTGGRSSCSRRCASPTASRRCARIPHQFSGGMRQRIAIAIALACRPKLLIADEPTTALDVTVQAGILRLLDRLRRENDLAVVLITHDLGVMSAIADRVSIFYAGRVVESGSREAVLQRPRHPYTQALLDALPHPEATRDQELVAIPGVPPSPGNVPAGCAFHPRCSYTRESCRSRGAAARPGRRPRARLSRRPVRRAMSALELRDVVVDYDRRSGGRVRAVAGASLSVETGQIVGLVGESGCGKSTLARAAVGLVEPTSGSVVFDGRPVATLGRRGRQRDLARLQLVFQNPYSSLNPRRKIGSQIADALVTLDLLPAAQRPARVRELCELVGLPARAVERFPHEFSGGQRQRIAVARALAAEPSVIVLDEPLASLDASAQAQLANLLVSLSRELGLGLLLISHDLAIVRYVADEVSVMYLGLMVETGPTRAALGPAAASLQRVADQGDPAPRRQRLPARRAPGRGARSRAAAARVPLPSALPLRASSAAAARTRRSSRSAATARPPAGSSPRGRLRHPRRSGPNL